MKTIKQIADEIGVSKQAVFKKIDNLGLRQRLMKNNNQWLMDESIEKTIKESFSTTSKTSTSSSTDSSTVDSLVDMLRNELEIKNRQINNLNERLAESQRLLDQEQQLRMVTERKLLLLEENQGKEDENPRPEEEEKETSFWRRLWHK